MAELIDMPFGYGLEWAQGTMSLDGGPYPPYRGAIFREENWQPIVKYRDCLP